MELAEMRILANFWSKSTFGLTVKLGIRIFLPLYQVFSWISMLLMQLKRTFLDFHSIFLLSGKSKGHLSRQMKVLCDISGWEEKVFYSTFESYLA